MRTIRNNKDRIEAMYNNLLAYCGNSGDWVGAIRAYEVGIVISLVEINQSILPAARFARR
jgi:hypothetical protein